MNTQTRKEILESQFFFNCECKHCRDNDEKTVCICIHCQHPFNIIGYRSEDTIHCNSCSERIDLRIYAEFFKQISELREEGTNVTILYFSQYRRCWLNCLPFVGIGRMTVGDYEKACDLFNQCDRLQNTCLEPACKEIFDNTIDLAECYYQLGENRSFISFDIIRT